MLKQKIIKCWTPSNKMRVHIEYKTSDVEKLIIKEKPVTTVKNKMKNEFLKELLGNKKIFLDSLSIFFAFLIVFQKLIIL